MIRIACQTITWGRERNGSDITGVMREVAGAGYDGIEIGARYLDPSKAADYAEALQSNGLKLAALHVGGNFLEPDSVRQQLEGIGETAELAVKLGANLVFLSGTKKDGKTAEEYRTEAESLNRIGRICRDNGAVLCYHNHNWEFLDLRGEGIRILLNETDPNLVFLVPDVGWVHRGGTVPVDFLEANRDRIRALHFKEFTPEGAFTELGRGEVDFTGCYEFAVANLMNAADPLWIVAEQDTTQKEAAVSAADNCSYIRSLR